MTRLAVPVPVYSNGKLMDRQELWSVGVWTHGERVSWGLLYADLPTHMCYEATPGAPYATKHAALMSGEPAGWWTFEVGRDIRVKRNDLIRTFIELRRQSDLIGAAIQQLAGPS